MSDMKGEYEVFKILREKTINGLSAYGVTSGVDVRRFAQANIANGDKLVLLNLTDTQRLGWQSFNYKTVISSNLKRTDEWIEQQEWQFSFIKRMKNTDTINTITADDLCNYCIAWFNGEGGLMLRNSGVACQPIDPHSVIVYNDDSDLYQRRPVFSMKLQVPKRFIANADSLSGINTNVRSL